jgi:ribonuclease P/MRP protein subunit POP5
LPTLKERKRYLAFEVISKEKMDNFSSISSAVLAKTKEFLGELGLAKAGIWLLPDKWNSSRQTGIIRVSHKYLNELKTSLALIKNIDNSQVIFRSIGVSGMLNKTKRFMIN